MKTDTKPKLSAQLLQTAFENYLLACKNHSVETTDKNGNTLVKKQPKIPTIKDFWCVYLGKPWASWHTALQQKTTATACQTICDTLEGIVLDALINGEGNSTGLIFDLKANYGYTDKQLSGEGVEIKKIEISVRRNTET